MPRFIAREFRDFLGCGALDRGFARVRCDACRFERLVPYPRCGGRMRVIAVIDDPQVVRRILTHLGLTGDEGPPAGPWPYWAA